MVHKGPSGPVLALSMVSSTARQRGTWGGLASKSGSAPGSEWPQAGSFLSVTLSLLICEVGMTHIPRWAVLRTNEVMV